MKPNSKKRSSNKSGAVLVTAVAVLLIISILMTATVGYVSVNRRKTNENYSKKQAYLTASSTLKSFITQIQLDTAAPVDKNDTAALSKQAETIKALKALAAADGGKGTVVDVSYNGAVKNDYRIGTTKLRIAQEGGSDTNIVVTAYTTYAKQTEKVAAHISTKTKRKPADFTNTIEVLGNGDVDWENLNVIGDTAGLKNSATIVYTFKSAPNFYGSYVMYGIMRPGTGGGTFQLKPNLIDPSRGSFVQVSENWEGEIHASSTMARADGYNYIYVGGDAKFHNNPTIGDAAHEIDLITHKYEVLGGSGGNDYVQYGNVYVYKLEGTTGTKRNGDCDFRGHTNVTIHGDLNVQGNLYMPSGDFTVTGNIRVGGTIDNATKAKNGCGGEFVENATITPDTRGAVPSMEISADDYKYFPEDFFMSSDNTLTSISGKYNAFYDESGNIVGKTTEDFYSPNFTTGDGAKFNFHVTQSCSLISPASFKSHSDDIAMNGKYSILIDVTDTSGDVVIMLKDKSFASQYYPEIVVRNTSSTKETYEDGIVTSVDHQFNCYFVSDSGKNIQLTGIDDVTGKSGHTGSKAVTYYFDKFRVFEYNTYINMFDASVYGNVKKSDSSKPKSSFVFNPTSKEIPGKFKPDNSNIIFLIGEGCKIDGQSNNQFFQATFYAPQATFGIKTNGLEGMTCCDANGSDDFAKNKNVLGIGVFIADKFNSQNTSYFVYTQPSPTSILSNAKGNKNNTLNGFLLDRYDHY